MVDHRTPIEALNTLDATELGPEGQRGLEK